MLRERLRRLMLRELLARVSANTAARTHAGGQLRLAL
jgi:hypothetical protein